MLSTVGNFEFERIESADQGSRSVDGAAVVF